MAWLRRLLSALFAPPSGQYICPSCEKRTADQPGVPCVTCEMAVL